MWKAWLRLRPDWKDLFPCPDSVSPELDFLFESVEEEEH